MPILLIALVAFAQLLSAGVHLRATGQDEWALSSGIQRTFETMRNERFRDLVRLYNSDPFDDPNGPGTAPGHLFRVDGLTAMPDAEGFVGEIILPTLNVGTEVLPEIHVREDIVDADLGLPRDLNGDSVIDAEDHGEDFTVLPVVLRFRWQGRNGPRVFQAVTLLSEFTR